MTAKRVHRQERRGWWRRRGNRRVRRSSASPVLQAAATIPAGSRFETVGADRANVKRGSRSWGPWLRSAAAAVARGFTAMILLAAVGAVGYFGYHRVVASHTFTVGKIVVEGVKPNQLARLKRQLADLRGRSIFRVSLASLGSELERRQPWIDRAEVYRVLPDTLRVVVVPQVPRAVVHLDQLYLVNASGKVFQRARLDEARGLPVITGIAREAYQRDPQRQALRIRRALAELARYQDKQRPAVGEIHIGASPEQALTFYLRDGGTALRLGGHVSEDKLAKLDAVWLALGPSAKQARAIYLDQRTRTDRVVVRMQDQTETTQ